MNATPPLSHHLQEEKPYPQRYLLPDIKAIMERGGRSVVQISPDAALACGKLTRVCHGGQPT